ncbi:MAG: hypothetical protein AAGA35_02720 [Patescibacteria group bacterium]
MDPITQQLKQRYQELPSSIQSVIDNNELRTIVNEVAQAESLDEETAIAIENEVALVMLLLTPADELASNLVEHVELEPDVAESVVIAMNATVLAQVTEELELENKKQPASQEQSELQSEITETEAAIETLPTIRTMESDQAAAQWETGEDNTPVHTSSQEHIFGQRPVLGDTPAYETDPAPTPRWDSEKP